jgi:hypothetical protein
MDCLQVFPAEVWCEIFRRCEEQPLLALSKTTKIFREIIINNSLSLPLTVSLKVKIERQLRPELHNTVIRLLMMIYIREPLTNIVKVEGDPFIKKLVEIHECTPKDSSDVCLKLSFEDCVTNHWGQTYEKPLQDYLDNLHRAHGFPTMKGFYLYNGGSIPSVLITIRDPESDKLKQAFSAKNKTHVDITAMLHQAVANGYKPDLDLLNDAIANKRSLEIVCLIAALGEIGLRSSDLLKAQPLVLLRMYRRVGYIQEVEWWNLEESSFKMIIPAKRVDARKCEPKKREESKLNAETKNVVHACAPERMEEFYLKTEDQKQNSQSHKNIIKLLKEGKLKATKDLLFYCMDMDTKPEKSKYFFEVTLNLIVSEGKIKLNHSDLEKVLIGGYGRNIVKWMLSKVAPTKNDIYLYLDHELRPEAEMIKLMTDKGGFSLKSEEIELIYLKYSLDYEILQWFTQTMGYKISRTVFQTFFEDPANQHYDANYVLEKNFPLGFEISVDDLTTLLEYKLVDQRNYNANVGMKLVKHLCEKGELVPTLKHVRSAIINGYPFEMVFCLLKKGGIKLTIAQMVQLMTKYQSEASRSPLRINFSEDTEDRIQVIL